MNNSDLLDELAERIESGELSRHDVMSVLDSSTKPNGDAVGASKSRLAEKLSALMYYIGGGIVFLGIVFLVGQEWDRLGVFMRIFVTFGSGIAAFVVGVLFTRQRQLGAAGPAFFLISSMLLPVGMFVAYDELGVNIESLAVQVQVTGVLFAAYLATYWALRDNVLLVFAFVFGIWLFFALTNLLIAGALHFDEWTFINYRILLCGLAMMLLGYSFTGSTREPLTGWLYGIGVCGFLGAGLALGEWKPSQSVFWESIYPGLVFGVIFLSVKLRSRSFLVFGSLALGAYLTKITTEYFSDSLGWALSLVLLGFALMGVAYLAVRINRHYVSSEPASA